MTIFEYSNYREYIKSKVSHLRSLPEGFSFRKFSSDAGFKSPNFLKLVMDGHRNLSLDGIKKVSLGLRLNAKESEYFELLVRANQSADITERFRLSEQLVAIKERQSQNSGSTVDYNYYKYWYNIPVREMLTISNLKTEVSKQAECFVPALSVEELKSAYQTLAQLRMIEKDENGKWKPVVNNVKTNDFFTSSMILNFHFKMMDLAKESLVNFRGNEREVSAVTFGLSKKNFEVVREKIKKLKAEVLALSENDQSKDEVFQMNVQLFPLTKGITNEI